ncbi:hypothetical protein GCM10009827_043480 [Dactylosporangium maewongense]|uniref:Uncharacterized protein n=1 Tax=Dactylosporangium maewongense TaxID=634393 RepID=A0ABP4LHX6_9ACTN
MAAKERCPWRWVYSSGFSCCVRLAVIEVRLGVRQVAGAAVVIQGWFWLCGQPDSAFDHDGGGRWAVDFVGRLWEVGPAGQRAWRRSACGVPEPSEKRVRYARALGKCTW